MGDGSPDRCVYSVEKQTALISATRAKVQEMFSGFLKHIWIVRFLFIFNYDIINLILKM